MKTLIIPENEGLSHTIFNSQVNCAGPRQAFLMIYLTTKSKLNQNSMALQINFFFLFFVVFEIK